MNYNLPQPTNQLASVLAALIDYDGVSEQNTPYNGFRTRISELKNKYQLPLKKKMVEFENQFGRTSKYSFHYLDEVDKLIAVPVYLKINNCEVNEDESLQEPKPQPKQQLAIQESLFS